MPYSIRLPDGTLVDNIPDDLNPLDAKRRIIAAYPQFAPETTILGQAGEAVKGLVPGAIGLIETGVAGASALLPEEYEEAVRAKTKEIATAAKKPFEASIGYEDTVGRKLGEAIGSTIPFLAAGPFGLAGRAAAVGLGTAAGAGEARTRAEAEGATAEQRAAATGYGIIPGAAEAFAPLRILGRLGDDIVGGGVAYVKRALVAGGEEAAQEAASGFAQNLIAKGIYKPEQELIEGLGEQAAYGGATGAIVQGLLDLAIGRRARGPAAPAEPAAEAPPAPPVVTNYQTIDQAGNPTTISVAQDDTGTIVATGPDGEPIDLSNMVSAGFTVEDSIQSVFSAPDAPVVPAAPRVEPEITLPSAPEITLPIASVSEAAPPREIRPTFAEEAPPPFETAPVSQEPLPKTPDEVRRDQEMTELSERADRLSKVDRENSLLEFFTYRPKKDKEGKPIQVPDNRLDPSEVTDIASERTTTGKIIPDKAFNFIRKKGGQKISTLINDQSLNEWLPFELRIYGTETAEELAEKEPAAEEYIKTALRNSDFLPYETKMELDTIGMTLDGIETEIQREIELDDLRDILTEIAAEEESARDIEQTLPEGAPTGAPEPTGQTRIESAAQREGAVSSAQPTIKVRTDNPRGEWLKDKQELSIKSGLNQFNVPNRFGSVTATLNRNVLVPVDKLADVKGMRGEQRAENIRPKSLESLTELMSSTGRLPPSGLEDVGDYAPFLNIYQNGTPYVNEGNHRIMVAKKLGWKYLPVEVSWFNGAELAGGSFSPEALIADDKAAHDQGFSLDNYNGTTPKSTAAQREDRAIADRERELFALQTQTPERVGAPTGDLFGAEGAQQIRPAPKTSRVPDDQLNLFNSDKDFVENSANQGLAQVDTSSPNFKRFFKDSKVVDNNGKPLIVYHSTTFDFDAFDTNRESMMGEGSFFSAEPSNRFIEGQEGGNIIPAYLSLQNPKYFTSPLGDAFNKQKLIQEGYDGVIIKSPLSGNISVAVAFDPAQIKSAISNTGEFSPSDPRITQSVGNVTNIAEAQRVEKALKGKNPLQAAKWMAANATNPDYRMISKRIVDRMQKLMDAGVPFKLHIVGVGDRVPVGLLSADGTTSSLIDRSEKKILSVDIWLNNSTVTGRVGTEEKIVLHELIHAVTAGATYLGNLKSMQGTEAAKLFTRLYDVRNAVVRHFNSRVKSVPIDQLTALEKKVYINGANVLKDEDEILAWGLTDPDMQAYLESIPYKGKTAWNAFVDAIREFLGLPKAKETALSEVLAIADELFALPVMEAGKQELVKSAPSAKPIATQDQINLFNASVRGQKVKMTPTAEGQAALDTINDLGRQVEETPTMRQKAREYWDNATDNPQATKEAAKKATVRFLDKIETYVFNSDAAINNAIRRLIKDTTMSEQEKMGILLSISSSQAVHPDALANLFIRYGGLNYDPSIYKYVAVDKKDNFVSLVQGIDTIGSKYGLTKEQAERVSHTAFEAKRLNSIARFNRALKVEIDDLRDMARTASDPTARDLASKEVRRKVKDFKFVHMTDEQIQRGLELFNTIPELNALVDTWNGIRENSRKELVESGLWSEQEAEGLLSNMDYVPFYREDQLEKGKGPKEFLRNLQVQAKEKKLKGSDKPVADIFDNMARWTQYAVKRSVMNRLALAKIDAAVEMGIAKKVEKQTQGDNSVRVWRDGNAEYYSLDDPLFMEAFIGLESVAIPSLKYFAKLSNLLRQSVVLYPLFSISQVPQDAFAAMFSSGLKTRFALTIPARAVKEFVKTLFKSSQTHKELERIGVVGIRDFTAQIAREDAEIYAGLKARPGVLNKVKSFLEHVAMASDNAVRQAVYEASIAQGTSRAEAIEKAFNLINFRNRGSSKELAIAGQVIPFFNAYLAAQHVAYRTISGVGISPTERKAALGTLAATTASVMTLSLIYAMLIGDDEDYLNKPSVMRDRLFMIPGTGITIPIRSDIFSIPKIITEHMYMLMTDNGASDGRKFRDSMKAALGNALLSPTVFPQAIKPLFEVGINYNFFQGRPLVGTYQKGLETERQFNDSTSELAKLFGQTGMVSPIAADHLIRGMLGSVGGLTLYMTNFALHSDPEAPRPAMSAREAIAALPGTSGFISKEYETALKNDFYVLRDEVSTAVNTLNDLKKRSPHEIEEFLADETNLTRVGMAKAVNRITKNLTDIRREISRITAADQMSASEKAEQIRELKTIEREILQNVDLKSLREMANL